MKKITSLVLAIAIATFLCVSFVACNNDTKETAAQSSEATEKTTFAETTTSPFANTTFVSAEAEEVFRVIENNLLDTQEGYNTVVSYLKGHPSKVGIFDPITDVINYLETQKLGIRHESWTLGNDCYLLVYNRQLYLQNTDEKIISEPILKNVDTLNAVDPQNLPWSSSGVESDEWIIENMTYSFGKFYYLGDIVFDMQTIDKTATAKIIGYTSSDEGVNFIVVKCQNKIGLIKECNLEFSSTIIADDAVIESEEKYYDRTDRFKAVENSDATIESRSVFYRSDSGSIVQLDLLDDSVKKTIIAENSEKLILIHDYEGIVWINEYMLKEEKISEIIQSYKYPDHYINRDGEVVKYTLSQQ